MEGDFNLTATQRAGKGKVPNRDGFKLVDQTDI